MTRALFTSTDSGAALPATILALIGQARACAASGAAVELQTMCFALTDQAIAQALIDLCRDHPSLTLRILADWNQSARGTPAQLDAMANARLHNLYIKFKLDAPYVWEADTGRLRYSYPRSWGMLHHKTLLLRVDGTPVAVAFGSYNWSERGQRAYENLLLSADPVILTAFGAEFDALWRNHLLTGTTDRVDAIFTRIKAEAARGADLRDPALLTDMLGIAQTPDDTPPPPRRVIDGPVIVGFSGSNLLAPKPTAGHATAHDRRGIMMRRPNGESRRVPLTLNTLSLEAIRSVPAGAQIKLAMFALSPRVPEFGALIDAARRGVDVQVILDGTINGRSGAALAGFATRERLPLSVRLTRRRMHQKYLVCPEIGMVLTGTANMTEETTARHSDHRILFRDAPALAQSFATDFDVLTARLSQPRAASA